MWDVRVKDPQGHAIQPVAVTREDEDYVVTLPPMVVAGRYAFAVGPDVVDLAGNQMDQNGNGTPGEADDFLPADFDLVPDSRGPEIVGATSVVLDELTGIRVDFNEPMRVDSITSDDITLKTPSGGIVNSGITVVPLVTTTLPGGTELVEAMQITTPAQTELGDYVMTIGASGPRLEDLSGNRLDSNQDGLGVG